MLVVLSNIVVTCLVISVIGAFWDKFKGDDPNEGKDIYIP